MTDGPFGTPYPKEARKRANSIARDLLRTIRRRKQRPDPDALRGLIGNQSPLLRAFGARSVYEDLSQPVTTNVVANSQAIRLLVAASLVRRMLPNDHRKYFPAGTYAQFPDHARAASQAFFFHWMEELTSDTVNIDTGDYLKLAAQIATFNELWRGLRYALNAARFQPELKLTVATLEAPLRVAIIAAYPNEQRAEAEERANLVLVAPRAHARLSAAARVKQFLAGLVTQAV